MLWLWRLAQILRCNFIHRWAAMASDRSKALLQLGHFLIRFASRSSTQPLQKTWPHPFNIVFLKLLRQTEQITKF